MFGDALSHSEEQYKTFSEEHWWRTFHMQSLVGWMFIQKPNKQTNKRQWTRILVFKNFYKIHGPCWWVHLRHLSLSKEYSNFSGALNLPRHGLWNTFLAILCSAGWRIRGISHCQGTIVSLPTNDSSCWGNRLGPPFSKIQGTGLLGQTRALYF